MEKYTSKGDTILLHQTTIYRTSIVSLYTFILPLPIHLEVSVKLYSCMKANRSQFSFIRTIISTSSQLYEEIVVVVYFPSRNNRSYQWNESGSGKVFDDMGIHDSERPLYSEFMRVFQCRSKFQSIVPFTLNLNLLFNYTYISANWNI